mgnify:CR=1
RWLDKDDRLEEEQLREKNEVIMRQKIRSIT